MENLKKFFRDEMVLALLLMIVGIILVFFPIESLSFTSTAIAILVSIGCLGNLIYFFIDKGPKVKMDTIYFILCLVGLSFGIYTFFKPTWLVTVLNVIVGLVLLVCAGNNLRYLFKYTNKNTLWWVFMGLNILIIILGVISLVNPLQLASTIIRLEGISLILAGIMSLLTTKKYVIALK